MDKGPLVVKYSPYIPQQKPISINYAGNIDCRSCEGFGLELRSW